MLKNFVPGKLGYFGAGVLFIASVLMCNKAFDPVGIVVNLDCGLLNSGLLHFDSQVVAAEVNKLTDDLQPAASTGDALGQEKNLNKLIDRLNEQCSGLYAEKICYACIETLPPQSEIFVQVDSLGTIVFRVLDISTPDDKPLQCIRVHEH